MYQWLPLFLSLIYLSSSAPSPYHCTTLHISSDIVWKDSSPFPSLSPPLSSINTELYVLEIRPSNYEDKEREEGSNECTVAIDDIGFTTKHSWKSSLLINENKLVLYMDSWEKKSVQVIGNYLSAGITLNVTCGSPVSSCYKLKVVTSLEQGNKGLLSKRSLGMSQAPNHNHSYNSMLIIVGVVLGVALLTLAGAVCAKSATHTQAELPPQSTGTLKILSGPPPEYFTNPPPIEDTVTKEATIHMGDTPSSPTSISPPTTSPQGGERDRSYTNSPETGNTRRKMVTPLPEIPKLASSSVTSPIRKVGGATKDEDDEGEEGEESPYDYAKFDNSVQARSSNSLPSSAREHKTPPYAMVTRTSNTPSDPIGSYTEVRHMGGTPRGRSVTEPVEPLPLLSPPLPPPLPRTFTEGASSLPLPLPPRHASMKDELQEDNDDTYDSIENLASGKLYDSVREDGEEDDNEEMYERVTEEIKEDILSSSAPTQHSFPPLKFSGSSEGSPSPTKHVVIGGGGGGNLSSPDSPSRKKLKSQKDSSKRKSRTESSSAEDDKHHRLGFFNRIRSSSTSAATTASPGNNTKKDHLRKVTSHDISSPDHHTHHASLPPLPPQPGFLGDAGSPEDEEDEDDMYDSVRDKPFLLNSAPLRSATLPSVSNRHTPFNPRVNEPLPEVPEDSGSGSASLVVKRDRIRDKNDPNYDTVNHAQNEADQQEPDYDTVQKRGVANEGGVPKSTHNYAKVTSHGEEHTSIDHDNLGYAVVDPSIIERKRTNSLSAKKKENPYDRVKGEPDYSSVKDIVEGDNEDMTTPTLQQDETTPTQLIETQHTDDTTTREVITPPLLDAAYAVIDPKIIQRKRAQSIDKKTTSTNNDHTVLDVPAISGRDQSSSPAPPIPPIGDLGDISEFDPPPIPEQPTNLLRDDEDEGEESPYAKVGGATVLTDKEPRPLAKAAPTRNSILSSQSSDDGIPVYDSLDPQQEQPVYDSLDPPTINSNHNSAIITDTTIPVVYDSLLPSDGNTAIS